jgi:hypothetical protein
VFNGPALRARSRLLKSDSGVHSAIIVLKSKTGLKKAADQQIHRIFSSIRLQGLFNIEHFQKTPRVITTQTG